MSTLFALTYNGLTIDQNQDTFSIFRMWGIDGLDVRISEANLTNFDGGVVYKRLYGMRTIGLEGMIQTETASEYFAAKATLVNTFSIKATDLTLSITRWDGEVRTIQAKVVQTPMIVEEPGEVTICRWRVELRCDDPSFYDSTTTTTYTINLSEPGGIPIPTMIPLMLGGGSNNTATIINNGQVDGYPEIIITGDVINPTITNVSTGEFIQIATTIPIGSFVRIKRQGSGVSVMLNDATNYYLYLNTNFSGDLFQIVVGTNLLRYTSSTYSANSQCQVIFTDSYINL